MTYEDEIYEIIYKKTDSLLKNMEKDYDKKYSAKLNNWMLDGFEKELISYLTFVSSFESKYGNMFENIVKDIARLKFEEENVPQTIRGIGVTEEEYEIRKETFINKNRNAKNPKQYIISKYNKSKNDSILTKFRTDRIAQGNGNNRQPSKLTQSELPKLLNEDLVYNGEIYGQEVDLIIFYPEDESYSLFEIKVGGNLDSSNAPKNIEKMLKIYSCLGQENAKLYFATLYHKDGEGNTWKGSVKTHVAEDCILIGKEFWDIILKDITFEELKGINKRVIEDTNFNIRIKDLTNNVH